MKNIFDLGIIKTTVVPEEVKKEFEFFLSLIIALYSLIKDLNNFDNYHRFRAIMAILETEFKFLEQYKKIKMNLNIELSIEQKIQLEQIKRSINLLPRHQLEDLVIEAVESSMMYKNAFKSVIKRKY